MAWSPGRFSPLRRPFPEYSRAWHGAAGSDVTRLQTGNPLDGSKVGKRFRKAIKRAKVREVRFHDLRHTFGTRMAATGTPMRTLQEWMGHRDFATTLIYADYLPDECLERDLIDRAFTDEGNKSGNNLSETENNSDAPNRTHMREGA